MSKGLWILLSFLCVSCISPEKPSIEQLEICVFECTNNKGLDGAAVKYFGGLICYCKDGQEIKVKSHSSKTFQRNNGY